LLNRERAEAEVLQKPQAEQKAWGFCFGILDIVLQIFDPANVKL